MDQEVLDKISDLKLNASSQITKITEYLDNKVKSTNKQLCNKNIVEITKFLNQVTENFNAAIDLAIEHKSSNDLLVEKIENALSHAQNSSHMARIPNFAQIVQNQSSQQNLIVNQNNNQEETILITAKQNCSPVTVALQSAEAIKAIRSKKKTLKINKLIKTNKGAILKIPRDEDIDNLINEFNQIDNLTEHATIYKPKKLDPIVVLKSVSKQTNTDNLPKLICDANLNPLLAGCEKKLKVMFVIKSQREYQDVVLRVNPHVYEILMSLGYVYTDFEKIIVKNKILVKQCQKCFKFGHTTNQCENPSLCVKCGRTADTNHNCPDTHRCINCASHAKYKNHDLNHPPNKPLCPVYNDQIKRLINMTCYKGLNHDIPVKQSSSQ